MQLALTLLGNQTFSMQSASFLVVSQICQPCMVTKASVTIIFDRSKSPTGYEQCKQIMVTRQVRTHGTVACATRTHRADCHSESVEIPPAVNGHKAQQDLIQTLFRSVRLGSTTPIS
ncbi:hypothetical protein M378DRAFT_1011584 [Amanita muscaria Koide BX008]|uniref:Uncharacterized protein n=1 Tax=Amanita muscaria (strain Koide BX008) TaxID=946122 RepID=A0A0C2SYW4_AMAMK|nr:hypothetical protein M378DRAFT_1011584 [Amanita muscaria Koide BX008]